MNAAESKGIRSVRKEAEVIPLRPKAMLLPMKTSRKVKKPRQVRYLVAVEDSLRLFDPLTRHGRKKFRIPIGMAYLLGAVLFHLGAAAVLIRLGDAGKRAERIVTPHNVLVSIQEPALPEPELSPVAEDPMPEPAVQQVSQKPVTKSVPKAVAKVEREMPVDPVDLPSTPTDTPPPRKVVGISFESTVTGGNGPAMAVGNTRMGQTAERAVDPSQVKSAQGGKYRGPGTAPTNQAAAAIPSDTVSLVKPKRLSSRAPDYPSLLKAQGIEGDVAVLIRIAPDGNVLDARVIKGSGQSAFDEAALDAAKKERFSPAQRNGEAIEYTLKYTYRFRVTG